MSLSLNALRALRAVAEARSYSGAARALGVTQPSVSQLIRKLERTYDVKLFSREQGQLTATPFCDRVCDAAERVMREHRALEHMLKHHGRLAQGELSVGLGNAMPGMAAISAFHKAYPKVVLKVSTGSHRQIMRAVLEQVVDVGILPEVPSDARFRHRSLLRNRVVAIVPRSHPLAPLSAVGVLDLLRERLIFRSEGSSTQKITDRYFRRQGQNPTPFLTLDTRDGVYEAVANGMGVGFVWQTGSGRNSDVRQLRLRGGGTDSEEVIFALQGRSMETVDAFFRVAGTAQATPCSARLDGPVSGGTRRLS